MKGNERQWDVFAPFPSSEFAIVRALGVSPELAEILVAADDDEAVKKVGCRVTVLQPECIHYGRSP
jgi:hypothetical protein